MEYNMKLQIASDLHLHNNFLIGENFFIPTADTLILAGDVCQSRQIFSLLPVFKRISETWKTVLYVPGNHEFYNGSIDKNVNGSVAVLKEYLRDFRNIHVMDNEFIDIENITFIGSTLWSDLSKSDVKCIMDSQSQMNDYELIYKKFKKVTAIDTLKLFRKNVKFIKETLSRIITDKIVVITHHAPSLKSISPKFHNSPINGAFVSDLEYIITSDDRIKLWCHGHTHFDKDYYVEQCRIICHPKGYNQELYNNSNEYIPLSIGV